SFNLANSTTGPSYSVAASPAALAFSPDGRWMYGVTAGGHFQVYDLASNTAPATFNLGLSGVTQVVVAPDGLKAFVLTAVAVAAVDLSTSTPVVADVVPTLPTSTAIAMAPDGAWLYVTSTTGSLARYDLTDLQLDRLVPLNLSQIAGLDISPDGTRAVVTGT